MKVLVCGGRVYLNYVKVKEVMDDLHIKTPITLIVHGAAAGADSLGRRWALENNIPHSPFNADWKTHGRAAGHIRNNEMLNNAAPDIIVAFPGGKGTENMIVISEAAGKQVIVVKDNYKPQMEYNRLKGISNVRYEN